MNAECIEVECDIPDNGSLKPVAMPLPGNISRKSTMIGTDHRLKNAKTLADQAIKNNKIFTIQGPYPVIREGLRRRGWVEKFYSTSPPPKPSPQPKKSKSSNKTSMDENNNDDDDDDDDGVDDNCDGDGNQIDYINQWYFKSISKRPDHSRNQRVRNGEAELWRICQFKLVNDHGGTVAPWEEENGFYGVTSRLVRNASPQFIWGVRRDVIDPKLLTREQVVNHYGRASFTTKVGLCMHLRNLLWYQPSDSRAFYPRCYRLSHEEDRQEFIDDFVLTACVSLLRIITEAEAENLDAENKIQIRSNTVPERAIEIALTQCKQFLKSLDHDDIDQPRENIGAQETEWFLNWYYQAVHKNAIVDVTSSNLDEISEVLGKMKENCAQFEIDGTRNVWIVKPGAKSRGRGIQCYNCLDDMLKLVTSQVATREGRFVVQKYIERPLLIYRTKFDIRQWFLVTDWNPLTMWFYKECYLRFCSQEFTLESFDESIHLSNNSIQQNYKNGNRAEELPDENMWTGEDFQQYIKQLGVGHLWDDLIYPGMKNAIICTLMCSQDEVEHRKSAFELYGADFMLDDSYRPWLIEINSSPCMAPSTKITAKMCSDVLEDTIRVVLDRKADKNADVGLFELAYRQPLVVTPHYSGINLHVDGTAVKHSESQNARKNHSLEHTAKEEDTNSDTLSIRGAKWQSDFFAHQDSKIVDDSVFYQKERSRRSETKSEAKARKMVTGRNNRNSKASKVFPVLRARGDADHVDDKDLRPKRVDSGGSAKGCRRKTPSARSRSTRIARSSFCWHQKKAKTNCAVEEAAGSGSNDDIEDKLQRINDERIETAGVSLSKNDRLSDEMLSTGKAVSGSEIENRGFAERKKEILMSRGNEKSNNLFKTGTDLDLSMAKNEEFEKTAKSDDKTHSKRQKGELKMTRSQSSADLKTSKWSRLSERKALPIVETAEPSSVETASDDEFAKLAKDSSDLTLKSTDALSSKRNSLTVAKSWESPYVLSQSYGGVSLSRDLTPQKSTGTYRSGNHVDSDISIHGLQLLKPIQDSDVALRGKAATEFPLVLRIGESPHSTSHLKAIRKDTQSTFPSVNFPPERNNRPGLDYGESNPIHTLYPSSTNPWKSHVLPLSRSLAACDTWRKRVALSLCKRMKNPAGIANQKFVFRYTNSVSDRSAPNHHHHHPFSSGISSLAPQCGEKVPLDGPRRTHSEQRSQIQQTSFVTQSFSP